MEEPGQWVELADTARRERRTFRREQGVTLEPFSVVLLRFGQERRSITELPARAELAGVEVGG
jgi:hypothetical protein